MANISITPSLIAVEALALLARNIEGYGEVIYADVSHHGDTVVIRAPHPQVSLSTETTERVVLGHYLHCTVPYSRGDLSLGLEEFSRTYIEPAMNTLAVQICDLWQDGSKLVTADLPLPPGAYRTRDPRSGLALRLLQDYDDASDSYTLNFSVLCGFTAGTLSELAEAISRALRHEKAVLIARLEALGSSWNGPIEPEFDPATSTDTRAYNRWRNRWRDAGGGHAKIGDTIRVRKPTRFYKTP
jgi:hypothetical protein